MYTSVHSTYGNKINITIFIHKYLKPFTALQTENIVYMTSLEHQITIVDVFDDIQQNI